MFSLLNLRCNNPLYTPLGTTLYIWDVKDTDFNKIVWYIYKTEMIDGYISNYASIIEPVNIEYNYTEEDNGIYNHTVTVKISTESLELPYNFSSSNYVLCFRQDNRYIFVGVDYGLTLTESTSIGNNGSRNLTFSGLSKCKSIIVTDENIQNFFLNAHKDPGILNNYTGEVYYKFDEDITMSSSGTVVNPIVIHTTLGGIPLNKNNKPVYYNEQIAVDKLDIYYNDLYKYYVANIFSDVNTEYDGRSAVKYKYNTISVNNGILSGKAYITGGNTITDKLVYKNEKINYLFTPASSNIYVDLTDETGNYTTRYNLVYTNKYLFGDVISIPKNIDQEQFALYIRTNIPVTNLAIEGQSGFNVGTKVQVSPGLIKVYLQTPQNFNDLQLYENIYVLYIYDNNVDADVYITLY